jgi:hypothetical protein
METQFRLKKLLGSEFMDLTMQDFILNVIRDYFRDYTKSDHSWITKSNYTNCGSIYFIDSDYATAGSFVYDFQSDGFRLTFFDKGVAPHSSVGFEPVGSVQTVHGKYENLPEAFEQIKISFSKIFKK